MPRQKRYEKLVAHAKKDVTEISPADVAEIVKENHHAILIDVREKEEWDEDHIPEAIHLSRGTIESAIEEKVPDSATMIICHCGGSGRSVLAANSLQKMGYENVWFLAGGFKAWKELGFKTTSSSSPSQ
jgi:rhodanese-related sulfurtransferase